jgi:Tol biopolymer transport system component
MRLASRVVVLLCLAVGAGLGCQHRDVAIAKAELPERRTATAAASAPRVGWPAGLPVDAESVASEDACLAWVGYSGELVLAAEDGRILASPHLPGSANGPAWSPDGRQLAVSVWSPCPRQDDILLLDARGRVLRNLTNTPYLRECSPAWSPDGAWIACEQLRDDLRMSSRVVAVGVSTGDVIEVERWQAGFGTQPTWRPDGTSLAYLWNSDPGPRELERSEVRLVDWPPRQTGWIPHRALAHLDGWGTRLRWSPSGDKLAYERWWDSLYVLDMASGTAMTLYDAEGVLGDCAWSPGGERIVFCVGQAASGVPRDRGIWLADPTGDVPPHRFSWMAGGSLLWSSDGRSIWCWLHTPEHGADRASFKQGIFALSLTGRAHRLWNGYWGSPVAYHRPATG